MNDQPLATVDSDSPGAARSLALRILGALFIVLGVVWLPTALSHVTAGTAATFVGARSCAYAVTYIAAGAGMLLHARWAAFAVAAWGIVAFSQLVYPPIPRDQVPLGGQLALALIALFWMLGLVFFVRRRTRN